jgi:tetratricopeptide (TPR) repeat protein
MIGASAAAAAARKRHSHWLETTTTTATPSNAEHHQCHQRAARRPKTMTKAMMSAVAAAKSVATATADPHVNTTATATSTSVVNVVDPMFERQRASAALLSVGSDLLSQGKHREAMKAFDAAFTALTNGNGGGGSSGSCSTLNDSSNNANATSTEWTDFQYGQHHINSNNNSYSKTSQRQQQRLVCPATAALARLQEQQAPASGAASAAVETMINAAGNVHNSPSLVDGFDHDITTAQSFFFPQNTATTTTTHSQSPALVTPNSSVSSHLSEAAATATTQTVVVDTHPVQTNNKTTTGSSGSSSNQLAVNSRDERILVEEVTNDDDSDFDDESRCKEEDTAAAPAAAISQTTTTTDSYVNNLNALRTAKPFNNNFNNVHCTKNKRTKSKSKNDAIPVHVDTYHEDECDVGPRPFQQAFVPTQDALTMMNVDVLQLIICYNQALVHHAVGETALALQLYNFITGTVMSNGVLEDGWRRPNSHIRTTTTTITDTVRSTLARLAMRAHNNMGQLDYAERSEEVSLRNFETALSYAKAVPDMSTLHQLEIATVLSNWCRVQWMIGRVDDTVYQALEEVLRIRYTFLGWDHLDVASAHFNLGMAEYSRDCHDKALSHLMKYLQVSSHRLKTHKKVDLDPIPGLVFVLLIKNDHKPDKMSQDLVWGLRTLQDKRQDLGPKNAEVASVINFIGTILFHQRELDHALLFFQEELRIEEQLVGADEDVSVSVTCNNIGRILQELGRYPQAIYYYQRSLRHKYGDLIRVDVESGSTPIGGKSTKTMQKASSSTSTSKKRSFNEIGSDARVDASEIPASTMNLYSTVWYNLGLIHDKMGAFTDAIRAFHMSLKLRRAMLGRDHPDVACLLYNIGVLQMEQQQLREATESFREALRIRRVASTGQLNDRHVIKTLQKLSSLHKAKGNFSDAMDASMEVLQVLKVSDEFDSPSRHKHMGMTLRDIAELYHAQGDLTRALEQATESFKMLRSGRTGSSTRDEINQSLLEQETAALLLIGSIQHERCAPDEAQATFCEAARLIRDTLDRCGRSGAISQASLQPLLEVSNMLATAHCAPEA